MITYKKWKPDTCDCFIREGYDSEKDVFFLDSVIKTCDAHSGLKPDDLWVAVKEQNARKNKAVNALLTELATDVGETKIDGSLGFKSGVEVSWSWTGKDADRVLDLKVSGIALTESQISKVKTQTDTSLGIDKVSISNG